MSFDPYNGFHVPVNFGWNVSVEHQWATSLTSRIAYVGSHGSHQWEATDINSKYISGPNAGRRVFQFTPSGQPSGLSQQLALVNMGGNSSYNSLQFSLTKRLRNGLSFLANYTWSKTLTDLPWNASATAVVTGQSYVLPTYMPDYKRLDYGPSEFDHRNVIAISYTWELPAVTAGPAALRYMGSHWETGGIYSFRSGDPLTILSGQDNSGTGEGRDRAVYSGSGAYGGNACGAVSPCKDFLNPASFAVNPKGTFGNVQKGEFVGPQYSDWDVNLMRYFPITETAQFQFRAEFFNVFNHTNFSDPANTLGSSFGRISGASDPRIGQLSLKLLF